MDLSVVFQSIDYVTQARFFWSSMGFTTAIAMFVGATIYDGHIEQAKKGVIGVLSYILMLLWVTLIRVADSLSGPNVHKENFYMAYAGSVSIFFLTFFWLIGIILGVLVFRLKKNKGGEI